VVLVGLVGSVALNLLLYAFAESTYRELQAGNLDPIATAHFVPRNQHLGPPAPGLTRIVLFGDSRVARWSNVPEIPGAEIVNQGYGGDTTARLLLRLERDVIALQPAVVVLQAGINDLKAIPVLGDAGAEIPKNCQANLDEIVARLRKAGIDVVLVSILPAGPIEISRRPVWSESVRDATTTVNSRLSRAPRAGVDFVDADSALAASDSSNRLILRSEYAADALHLNDAGYRELNSLVAPVLTRLIEETK
jgi:lysophospholipase L1-like esterase